MKLLSALAFSALALASCTNQTETKKAKSEQPINGTWKLVSAKTITKGDTVSSFPVENQEMIKQFNDTHFSFFKHDISKGKGKNTVFDAGSGTYTLNGDKYEEHLQYCSYRDWEDLKFSFTVNIKNDTLVQRGIEKIDSLNVNHEIVETYVKLK
ncbi:lipocalin family protein [Pedobacter sp. B4-66]|uniref:lipocalin family protein n=1 Tax=Pedobacter sp. B4-66 TaxID=2817280 RepID=UPI001BDB35FB|nr:lipocalin family protein [Pedobacter sp. B4-66]